MLGSLILFIVYINDLCKRYYVLKRNLFATNTNMFYKGNISSEILNSELDQVS